MADVKQTVDQLRQVAVDAAAEFGGMSAVQLNWKADAKTWSVAQCFDHLITTHSLYFPVFSEITKGDTRPTFWEKASPLSGFFGRFLIKRMDPANLKKMKTTAKAQPSASAIGGDIIERFVEHQEEIIAAVAALPADVDSSKTVITSPLMGLVTYTLEDTFTILAHHCRRHFNQAKRVAEMAGFPA